MQYDTLQILSDREWILTNGLGGYALGFGNMINKRKYNGLLISSTKDLKRNHILATIEEKLEDQGAFFYFDSNHYLNCIYPNGYNNIVRAYLRPYPCFLYSSVPFNKNYLIGKEIFLFQKQNAVAIKYTNYGKKFVNLVLRPKFTLRDHHFVNTPGTWDGLSVEKDIHNTHFRIRRPDNGIEAYGYLEDGDIIDDQINYKGIYYPMEANRGYESVEDILSPVRMTLQLPAGKHSYVVFSAEPLTESKKKAIEAEQFYKKFPLPNDHPDKVSPASIIADTHDRKMVFNKEGYYKTLEMAVRDFIVGDDDIVAGYPWFGIWARDTLISLEALENLSGGSEIALKILKKYGAYLRHGMLPNTFGEGGEGLNYDSVDAPLWYILRCYQCAPKDKELFTHVCNIILNYLYEENNPFFVALDGLIEVREGSHALTWMDAKVYNNPITPRWGKPIEINALWFNALCIAKEMAKNLNVDELRSEQYCRPVNFLDELIDKAKISLQKFIGIDYFADRLENDVPVWEIRPNAIIALSLPFDFAEKEQMKRVHKTAKEKLLTPYGLRSLDPSHPAFKQKYIGNQKQRDLAYHQGTVWAFLLLPFVKLTWKILNNEMPLEELIKEITGYIWAFREGFMKNEIASVAEIWDAIDPYFSKGCPAQAWSVCALYEIENILLKGRNS